MKEVTAVAKIRHCVDANLSLCHFADQQVDGGIKFLVAIYVDKDLENSTGKLILRILRIDLGSLNRTHDEFVFDGNFHHFTILRYSHSEVVLVEDKCRGCFDLSNDPSTERNVFE